MNTVSGKILVKETGIGIANLLVVVYDADSAASPTAAPPGEHGNRIGSVVSDEKGNFRLTFEDHLFAAGDPEKRPDLLLGVFAPEDSQGLGQPLSQPPPQRLLLLSNVARQDAGEIEAYVLRIPQAQLEHFAIPNGNGAKSATNLGDSVLRTWETRDALREQLKPRIREEAAKARQVKEKAKTLFKSLSAVPPPMKESPLFVRRGEPQDKAQGVAIEQGMARLEKYRGAMRLRLSEEEVVRMGLEVTK